MTLFLRNISGSAADVYFSRRAAARSVLLFASGLAACGPLGALGDVVGREQKDRERQALAEKIRRRWLEKDSERFRDLRVSVSYSNDWQRLFATQYTLVLTGSVREEWDRELAVILAREALGVDERRVFLTNDVRVKR